MKLGVLGVQGAVKEHERALKNSLKQLGTQGDVETVHKSDQLDYLDGLVIPGGESSTISRLLTSKKMREKIIEKGEKGLPIMGTCAGAILLASMGGKAVEDSATTLLELMDMKVERNAFGAQRYSFENTVGIDGVGENFHAVFIRAPLIVDCWGKCRSLSELEGKIIAAEQSNLLALVFHPELTSDLRIHKYFIQNINKYIDL